VVQVFGLGQLGAPDAPQRCITGSDQKSSRQRNPARAVALQGERIARKRRLSDNRRLVEPVEQGLEAPREKEKAFFTLAERFRAAADPKQAKQLGNAMGRLIFG
jgi:hypothetical protein